MAAHEFSRPPLAVLMFTPQAGELAGATLWSARRFTRPYREGFDVHLLNRPPGLAQDISMPELAAVYAGMLRERFDGPVPVLGISTGGSVALQLAADHPELVGKLVLGGTACTLGPLGRKAQRAYMRRAREGRRPSPALAELVSGSVVAQRLLAGMLWLADGRGNEYADAIAMLHAEDGFDLSGRLGDVKAATLLINGDRDRVYPLELAKLTAAGISGARLIVYSGVGHGGTFNDKRFSQDVLAFLRD